MSKTGQTATLESIVAKHGFVDLGNQLAELDRTQRHLLIGILGEFSAGKSTLVNAMLGRKLLPATADPTTARITEILPIADQNESAYFLRSAAGELRPINVLEFEDALLTSGEEVAVAKVSTNRFLHDGYCIVDTPGLQSLDDIHTDITFGYLPQMDGAIVCHDINKGNLTASLKAFLSKPEVRPFATRIAFALTRADDKSPDVAERIRTNFCKELTELFTELRIQDRNLSERVITISGLNALDGHGGLDAVEGVIQNVFVARRNNMLTDRIKIERQRITRNAISRLHLFRDNLALDSSQYAQKRLEIDKAIQALRSDKARAMQALDEMKPELARRIDEQLRQAQSKLQDVSPEAVGEILNEIESFLQTDLSALVKRKFKGFEGIGLALDGRSLQHELVRLAEKVEFAKTAVTMAAAAAIGDATGGGGLVDAEAAAGGAFLRNLVKGSKLEKINPIEFIGDFAHDYFKSSTIDNSLKKLHMYATDSIHRQLHDWTEDQIFSPMEESYKAAHNQLDQLILAEKQDRVGIQTQREQVDQDILTLDATPI